MTDLEISKALALAIGWISVCVAEGGSTDAEKALYVNTSQQYQWCNDWRVFDYMDWSVIGPIAERYDCFPRKSVLGHWGVTSTFQVHETPQKAIALTVIALAK